MEDTANRRAGVREWIGLAVLALPTLLVSIDVFVILLALPRLAESLHADSTEQLWIMDRYGFLLSGLMLTMGTLGDRIGRRRLLLVGAAGFGAASVLAAFSTSSLMLIGARALLGVAGATLAPSTLALISNMFTDARQRGLAVGIWLTCFVGGAAVGPLVGGVLLAHLWWGSVFLLGVPAMALLMVLGPVLLREYRAEAAGRLDLPSVGLSLAAVLPAVHGLKELARHGPGPAPMLALAAGVGFGVLFVRRQRTLPQPLLDVRLFAGRAFTSAVASMFLGTMLLGALMMFISQHLQLVLGRSPLGAALWMLPAVLASIVSMLSAPLLARRFQPARLISGGLLVSITGLLLLARADAADGPLPVAVAYAVMDLGCGPLVALGTDLILGSVPPERAGSAAALNETSGEFGYALGIAALGSVGTMVYRTVLAGSLPAGLPADVVRDSQDGLAAATLAAGRLADPSALLAPARAAYAAGMHVAALISAALLLGVALLVATQLGRRPAPAAEPGLQPAA